MANNTLTTLHSALDAIPATIFLFQHDQVLYANRTAAAFLKRSPSELVGLRFDDVFESSSDSANPTYLKTPTGNLAVSLTNEEIELEGAPAQVITALRQEPSLESQPDSQLLFESIFESTVVGIAIISESAHYVRVNRTYGEIYGYDPEEIIGKHLFLIFPPQYYARAQETHDSFIRGEGAGVRSDWTVRRKNGEFIEISAFNNRLVTKTGERFRVVAVIDITEQKRAEQALRENRENLNSLLNTMGDAVWSVWADTLQIYFLNPAIEVLTGYSVDEFYARQELLFEIVHPEDRAYFLEHLHKVVSEKQAAIEHRIIRRDGAVRWVYKRFWLVESPQGNRIAGLMTDITDRKLAVEQALQLELENERIRILAGFVRDASHEFRTPLTIIYTQLDLLERNTNPSRQSAYLAGIRGQTERILTLVEALITVSRLDSLSTLQMQEVELHQLLESSLAVWQERASQQGITLTLQNIASPLLIEGNPREILVALNALIQNAIACTPQNGRIALQCAALNEREIAIDVVDTGIGIKQSDQQRIFERFYRVDQAHSTQGFGLGLPIARRIAELHHGRVEVESAFGQGSRFRLILPAIARDR